MYNPYSFIRRKWNLDSGKASIIGSDTSKEVGILFLRTIILKGASSHEFPQISTNYMQSI